MRAQVVALLGLIAVACSAPATARADSLFDPETGRTVAPAAVPSWTTLQQAERQWMQDKPFVQPLLTADAAELRQGLDIVNRALNARPYRRDSSAGVQTNHWTGPAVFFADGGDCEDFAIAKYFALRALGLAASAMRIVVLRDRRRDLDHAVLLVRLGADDLVLDNLSTEIVPWRTLKHYRPVYSVNENGAWLHTRRR